MVKSFTLLINDGLDKTSGYYYSKDGLDFEPLDKMMADSGHTQNVLQRGRTMETALIVEKRMFTGWSVSTPFARRRDCSPIYLGIKPYSQRLSR